MKVVRFGTEPGGWGGVALALPGLPEPRFAAVAITDAGSGSGDGIVVEQEWRRGTEPAGPGFVMVSVAGRHPSLTRPDFVDRWRNEAGRLGGEVIPDDVRGLAYVQLHPVDPDPPYDAITVVWCDGEAGLRRRAEWFATRPVPADLFVDPWSLYVRVASSA